MRPLALQLEETGWTTRGVLLPGFGPQIEKLLDYTYQDWLAEAEAALSELRKQHHPVMVVGYSLGGALAILLAARHMVDGLVLLAPFWKVDHLLWSLLPILKPVFRHIRPFRLVKLDFSDHEVRAGIHSFLPGTDLDDPVVQQQIRDFRLPLKLFSQIRSAGQHAYRSAPLISAPALVFQGREDDLVKPALTRSLVNRFATSPTYVEVPGKHDLPVQNAIGWSTIRERLLRFADSVTQVEMTARNRARS
ncbi:MAG: alpha/beta fold hydrolase [Anaerolineae bacterium]|nr:alpha/beta fold hydrolase [Anaerolineae bacterium]